MDIYNKIFDWYRDSRSADAGVDVVRLFAQKLQPNATILDLGCGYGAPITTTLLELGFKPYGIDSSIKMVEEFKRVFPGIPVQHADVLNSDFFSRSFSAIIGYGFIFHLPIEEQKIAIRKVANHIEHGGYLLFNSGNEDNEGEMTSPEYNGGESFMQYSMSRFNYEKVLQENGMTLISSNIEEGYGSTIYIAKKEMNASVQNHNAGQLN